MSRCFGDLIAGKSFASQHHDKSFKHVWHQNGTNSARGSVTSFHCQVDSPTKEITLPSASAWG
ncbi:hypothetical protein TSUD_315360 [Trifolium subterraneum]|uniref:Uncharacterized protein n=1 Tax=Trifolium subterraneum TaxID=3900 RepID=A0A2Z6MF13_TRISU|nr:hypothetical protein TSUD_315360 [Trifolium subterraneum]